MKVAEINKKTGMVVHIFESTKIPIFAADCPIICEDITGKDVLEGDIKQGSTFNRPEKQVKPKETTLSDLENRIDTLENKIDSILKK